MDSRGIRTVETGGRLLEVLCTFDEPMDLKVVATHAELASSVTHAYLSSFMRMGLVRQEPSSKRYSLGPLALELGLSELQTLDPIGLALDALRELKSELGQTVALSVWGSRGPTVIRVHRSGLPLHATLSEGVTLPVATTATGQLFAAYMPAEMVKNAVQMQGVSASELSSQMERLTRVGKIVRREGLARIVGSPVPGLVSLSAPVFNHSLTLVCALTLTGRTGDYDDGLQGDAATTLRRKVQLLSERLGMRSKADANVAPRATARSSEAKSRSTK
jgi:DNA-binding IclR family transcriptional regulator